MAIILDETKCRSAANVIMRNSVLALLMNDDKYQLRAEGDIECLRAMGIPVEFEYDRDSQFIKWVSINGFKDSVITEIQEQIIKEEQR